MEGLLRYTLCAEHQEPEKTKMGYPNLEFSQEVKEHGLVYEQGRT